MTSSIHVVNQALKDEHIQDIQNLRRKIDSSRLVVPQIKKLNENLYDSARTQLIRRGRRFLDLIKEAKSNWEDEEIPLEKLEDDLKKHLTTPAFLLGIVTFLEVINPNDENENENYQDKLFREVNELIHDSFKKEEIKEIADWLYEYWVIGFEAENA